MKLSLVALLALLPLLQAGDDGTRVLYVGGTVAGVQNKSQGRIEMAQGDALTLSIRNNAAVVQCVVPFKDVNTLEYGLHVSRRYVEAILISPMFLLAKKKSHFLTIGYTDEAGQQQAIVLQVPGGDIRALLVSLEARTGRKVEYQDEDARRAGKGSE